MSQIAQNGNKLVFDSLPTPTHSVGSQPHQKTASPKAKPLMKKTIQEEDHTISQEDKHTGRQPHKNSTSQNDNLT